MNKPATIYDSTRLAAGYAYHRPPVHQFIIKRIGEHLRLAGKLPNALDLGCGAGLSTAALEPLVESVIGVEPEPAMLAFSKIVAPKSAFLVGQTERLPLANRCFDLITAAGSINYADRDLFFPEVERVLTADGTLVIYDFSAGCRCAGDDRLHLWFEEFAQRYPPPPGYALDVTALDYGRYGLKLNSYQQFEVRLPMTQDAYLAYAMSETSVEQAILNGTPEGEIRDWCQHTLSGLFGDSSLEILFDAYIAYVIRDGRN